MSLPNQSLLIEGPFSIAVTIRRNGGGGAKVLNCIFDAGEVGQIVEQPDADGEATEHRINGATATFVASKVAEFSEGDEVIKDDKKHVVVDKQSDDTQTTFRLTEGQAL